MKSSWVTVKEKLESALAQHGAIGKFTERTGIHRATLGNWLRGDSMPPLDALDRIADALATTPADLLSDGADPIPADILAKLRRRTPAEMAAIRATLDAFEAAHEVSEKASNNAG